LPRPPDWPAGDMVEGPAAGAPAVA
jgi:hypothetical protein